MQNKNFNTKAFVESSILSACMIITMVVSVYLAGMDIIAFLVLPAIAALVYIRSGFKYSLMASVVALTVGSFLINPIQGLSIGLVTIFAGTALGLCIKREMEPIKAMLISSAGYFIAIVIKLFFVSYLVFPNGFMGFIKNIVDGFNYSIEYMRKFYTSAGISTQMINEMIPQGFNVNSKMALEFLPLTLILTSVCLGFLSYKLTQAIFIKIKIPIKKMKGITKFYIPNMLLALLIVLLCVGILLRNRNMEIGNYVFITAWGVFQTLLFLDSIGFLFFSLKEKLKMSNSAAVLTVILCIFILNQWFIMFGIVDSIFDFRKLDSSRIRKD